MHIGSALVYENNVPTARAELNCPGKDPPMAGLGQV